MAATLSQRAPTATVQRNVAPSACGLAARPALRGLGPAPLPAAARRAPPPMAAKAAAQAAEAVFEATGVPMVDSLMKMPSVEAAAQHSIKLVAAAAIGVVFGNLVFRAVDKIAGGALAKHADSINLPAAAIESALKPANALLPFYGLAYSATVASSLAQVAARKMSSEFSTLCFGKGDEVLAVLKTVTQLLQDTSELVVIVAVAWAAISFKDRIVGWMVGALSKSSDGSGNIIVSLMSPFSSIISGVIYFAAITTSLTAFGINISPLLASVGGLGLAVGLATQSVAQNVVAAVSLYSGGPFSIGDLVELHAGGVLIAAGTVTAVEPLATTLRNADGNPIYMSNAEVAACQVRNLTRKV